MDASNSFPSINLRIDESTTVINLLVSIKEIEASPLPIVMMPLTRTCVLCLAPAYVDVVHSASHAWSRYDSCL